MNTTHRPMTHRMTAFFATAALILFQGCAYSNIVVPLDDDVSTTRLGPKSGRASNHTVLWLVAWGDAGTEAAARDGGLAVINHLDREYYSVLFGLYSRQTTIAYGD